jgi:hypothetical protein
MEKLKIHKYKSWEDVPETNLEFWLTKTPNERLEAAKALNKLAREIYLSNPLNPPLENGRRISKFRSITERK